MPLPPSNESKATTIGFVTVWNRPRLGYIGGYLLLNAQARPVEFHCTAPVVPNRAQKILYGATLEPYLYGEQIGVTLVEKSKQNPRLLVTDCVEILEARRHYESPILFIDLGHSPNAANALASTTMFGFNIQGTAGEHSVAVASEFRSDKQAVETLCQESPQIDWIEPFERIREAISEAQRPAA